MGTIEDKSNQISDQDMFDSAVADESIEEKPEGDELVEPEAKIDERPRDAKGRFTGKAEGEAVTETETQETAPEPDVEPERSEQPEAKVDHRIPLTELLSEREKRQNAEREQETLRQQIWQLQAQMQQAAQQPQEPIDIFADPEAYQARTQQTIDDRLKAMEGNFSLRLAAYKHGEVFQDAWQEMVNRSMSGNDQMRQQVLNSPDPGETLVQLYQRDKVMAEVGDDPMAYVNRKLEEALDNPEFLAKALEKAKVQAGSKPTQNKIDLPPSLNKATSAQRDNDPVDASDDGMYRYATG